MNAPRCSPTDYIAYQIASPSRYNLHGGGPVSA